MIGLDIKVHNTYDSYLKKIFDGIDFNKYDWSIVTDDIFYKKGDIEKPVFEGPGLLSGEEFKLGISRDNYYMIFVDIKAYTKGSKIDKIETFDDFMKSECQLAFMVDDCVYTEFYCKDRAILDNVYSNCIGDDFEDVKYTSIEDVKERPFWTY